MWMSCFSFATKVRLNVHRQAVTIRMRAWRSLCLLALSCAGLTLAACSAPAARDAIAPHPVRFLLTFDDGPSLAQPYNPTSAVLEQLAHNAVQPQIKAVFFVQTRTPGAGGAPLGQQLLRRTRDEGHVLALHSGSVRGHKNHRYLDNAELDQTLADGIADIRAVTGRDATLV